MVSLSALLCATGLAAGPSEQRQAGGEPGSLRVFVWASQPADSEHREALEVAARSVRDRVRSRKRLTLVESQACSDVRLRITNYRTEIVFNPMMYPDYPDLGIEYHFVDGTAFAGDTRTELTGIDRRVRGAALRHAASHLVDELEGFCEEECRPAPSRRDGPCDPSDAGLPSREANPGRVTERIRDDRVHRRARQEDRAMIPAGGFLYTRDYREGHHEDS